MTPTTTRCEYSTDSGETLEHPAHAKGTGFLMWSVVCQRRGGFGEELSSDVTLDDRIFARLRRRVVSGILRVRQGEFSNVMAGRKGEAR